MRLFLEEHGGDEVQGVGAVCGEGGRQSGGGGEGRGGGVGMEGGRNEGPEGSHLSTMNVLVIVQYKRITRFPYIISHRITYIYTHTHTLS